MKKIIFTGLTCCVMCQTNFSNHDDFAVHSCKQIKVETNEFEDVRKIHMCQKETFDGQDISESNSDYSPKEKKSGLVSRDDDQ